MESSDQLTYNEGLKSVQKVAILIYRYLSNASIKKNKVKDSEFEQQDAEDSKNMLPFLGFPATLEMIPGLYQARRTPR